MAAVQMQSERAGDPIPRNISEVEPEDAFWKHQRLDVSIFLQMFDLLAHPFCRKRHLYIDRFRCGLWRINTVFT